MPQAPRFGVVEVGSRADLLLVAESPFASLGTLRQPLGVMAAGRWRTAVEMRAVLEQNRRAMEPVVRDAFGATVR